MPKVRDERSSRLPPLAGGGAVERVICIDWSAATTPVRGADSIWLAGRGRDGWAALANPATRAEAMALLTTWIEQARAIRQRVLIACDFPLGYPAGTAAALGHTDWRGIWAELGATLEDHADNTNTRFALAAAWNRRIGGAQFWGRPERSPHPDLPTQKPLSAPLPERRLVEQRVAAAQSVWKLYTTGSVGSQALTGIARLQALRQRYGRDLAVWPFDTAATTPAAPIVVAEMYPSLRLPQALPGLPKDAAQVATMAEHFLSAGDLFTLDPNLSPAEIAAVVREEGWILDLSGPARAVRTPYTSAPPTDANEIYRQSWAMIRASVDLSALTPELHPLARRLVHTTADPSIITDLAASPGAVAIARAALTSGAAILTDAAMVAHGVIQRALPAANRVASLLDRPDLAALAERLGTTRSAAAMIAAGAELTHAVVAIGNAPTALQQLLALIDEGVARPAVILGFCVGFVGAAEAKAALMARCDIAWIALPGRRGGSALAAAAVNALAAEKEPG